MRLERLPPKLLRWPILALLAAFLAGPMAAPADAAPLPVSSAVTQAAPAAGIEKAYYYGYRRPYYYRHYGYRRHYWHRHYGYRRPYYRRHFYYHRPYWHRRHYWHRRYRPIYFY